MWIQKNCTKIFYLPIRSHPSVCRDISPKCSNSRPKMYPPWYGSLKEQFGWLLYKYWEQLNSDSTSIIRVLMCTYRLRWCHYSVFYPFHRVTVRLEKEGIWLVYECDGCYSTASTIFNCELPDIDARNLQHCWNMYRIQVILTLVICSGLYWVENSQ